VVTAPPTSTRDYVIVHVDHLRPYDTSRLAESDRAIVNRRASTYISERVIARRGTPGKYEFLIGWRGHSEIRSTRGPLIVRTVDGSPSGVGHVTLVQDYMKTHGLSADAAPATHARTTHSRSARA